LLEAGTDPRSEAIRKGVDFMINAQLDDGSLIGAPHYTAMLVEILQRTKEKNKNLSDAENWIRNKSSTFKWHVRARKHAFIDAWILKALLEISEDPDSDLTQKIVESLVSQQEGNGSWGSIEDTGIVALTLYEVLKRSYLKKIIATVDIEKVGICDVDMVAESIVHSMLLPCSTEKPEDYLPKNFYQALGGGVLLTLYIKPERVKLLNKLWKIAVGVLGFVVAIISLLIAFKIV
jgi:hypothetical protein